MLSEPHAWRLCSVLGKKSCALCRVDSSARPGLCGGCYWTPFARFPWQCSRLRPARTELEAAAGGRCLPPRGCVRLADVSYPAGSRRRRPTMCVPATFDLAAQALRDTLASLRKSCGRSSAPAVRKLAARASHAAAAVWPAERLLSRLSSSLHRVSQRRLIPAGDHQSLIEAGLDPPPVLSGAALPERSHCCCKRIAAARVRLSCLLAPCFRPPHSCFFPLPQVASSPSCGPLGCPSAESASPI